MALESLPKISPANFSPDNDLIQVYSKKGDYVGVINPSYIKSSPSGVSGAIQFSDGSAFASDSANLFWDDTNNRLGIGVTSSTALTAQLSVGNTDFVVGANAGYSTYYGSSINGTIQATTSGSTTQLWFRANGNALNENDNFWSRIEQVQGGAMRILSSRYSSLVLGNNGYNNAITLYNSSAFTMPKVGINNSTPTALLQIGGVGSTSATTSLLVQNSSGSAALTITDDRVATINECFFGDILGPRIRVSGGNGIISCVYNGLTLSSGSYVQINNNTFYVGPGNSTNGQLTVSLPAKVANTTETVSLSAGSMYYGVGEGRLLIQAQTNASGYNALGNTYIAGGRNTNGGAHGNVYLGVDLTGALGNVGVGTNSINASAKLQVDSTTQGFLPPRMTDAQIRAIVAPTNGLVAYNTDINHLCCYQNGAWAKFSHSPM